MKRKIIITVGDQYGRLTVIAYDRKRGHNHFWKCRCQCGNETVVQAHSLATAHTSSCGCYGNECRGTTQRTHGEGHKYTKEYRAWMHAKSRCYNKNDKKYPIYGARGIRMCDLWLSDYRNFLADMGRAPQGMTLDRYPDMNGDYEPSNCRWATPEQQSNNTRVNRMYMWHGELRSIPQICRLTNLPETTLSRWVYEYGHTIYAAVRSLIEKKKRKSLGLRNSSHDVRA